MKDNKFVNNMCKMKRIIKDNDFNLIVFIWWAIWFKRNEKIFDDKTFSEKEVVQLMKKYSLNCLI